MKKVKELKVGDRVWMYSAHMAYDSGFVIKSIKKEKTLAIVTIDWDVFGKHKDVICYGHVSGELLVYNGAGFDSNIPLVCDYKRITEKSEKSERDYKYIKVGEWLTAIVRAFGGENKLKLF